MDFNTFMSFWRHTFPGALPCIEQSWDARSDLSMWYEAAHVQKSGAIPGTVRCFM